jgi:hypothetical protein
MAFDVTGTDRIQSTTIDSVISSSFFAPRSQIYLAVSVHEYALRQCILSISRRCTGSQPSAVRLPILAFSHGMLPPSASTGPFSAPYDLAKQSYQLRIHLRRFPRPLNHTMFLSKSTRWLPTRPDIGERPLPCRQLAPSGPAKDPSVCISRSTSHRSASSIPHHVEARGGITVPV